jgi:hypothetical protein
MATRCDRRQPDRRDGQGAAVSRRLQRLDHADQGAHRHAVDRHPHAGRRQGDRHRSGRDGQARQADRAGAEDRARARQSPMPSADRRLLSRHRPDRAALARYGIMVRTCRTSSRPRSAARPSPPRSRAASATASTCAIRATCGAIRRPSPRRAGADAGRRRGAAGRGRQGQAGARADLDPHRERPARGLHLRRYPRPRSRRLRRRRAAGGARPASSFRPATT